MPTITLHTSSVAVSTDNLVDASVLTGGGSAWDDADDSTYATVYTSYDGSVSSSAFQDHATGLLDALTLPGGSTVTGITLSVRLAKAAATPQSSLSMYISIREGSPGGSDAYFFTGPSVTSTPATFPLPVASGSIASLSTALASVSYVHVATFSRGDFPAAYHYGVKTFEASVLVDYTVGSSATPPAFAPPVTVPAPLRIHPRTDGLGTSSASRAYPPSQSYQASNRRAGGYL